MTDRDRALERAVKMILSGAPVKHDWEGPHSGSVNLVETMGIQLDMGSEKPLTRRQALGLSLLLEDSLAGAQAAADWLIEESGLDGFGLVKSAVLQEVAEVIEKGAAGLYSEAAAEWLLEEACGRDAD